MINEFIKSLEKDIDSLSEDQKNKILELARKIKSQRSAEYFSVRNKKLNEITDKKDQTNFHR